MHLLKQSCFPPEIIHPEGEIIQEIIGAQTGGVKSHSLAKVTLPPGKTSVPHYHKESEESYLILSGTAALRVDNNTFRLSAGDAVVIEPNEVHQITNRADVELGFLAVCVPAWHPGDSFNENQAESR